MKQLLITIVLCVGCITAADAQSTFTERLQKSNTGEGKISVTQDKSIDALVNGPSAVTKQPENIKPEQKEKATAPKDKASDKEKTAESKDKEKVAPKDNEAVVEIPDTIDMHKKVMKGYKINGYRVQVFAGGNSRNDRLKAERAGEKNAQARTSRAPCQASPSMYTSTPPGGSAASATTALTRRPTRCCGG